MIQIFNRNTKTYEEEKVAGGGMIKMLYDTPKGKLPLEFLIKRKVFSALSGILFDTGLSTKKIMGFIEEYKIDMTKCNQSVVDFKSFNGFFTRKQNPGNQSFNSIENSLCSPGDGRMRAWENIDINKIVQVKGSFYSLKELIKDEKLAEGYQGGSCIILRLAPVDYHRFHFIDSGTATPSIKIKGEYYSVNPTALKAIPFVFCKNKREYSILKSEHFGSILYIEVGATSVGTIIQTYKPGEKVAMGDEKGYFKFGGSTLILFLEKDRVFLDKDILEQTELGFESKVFVGDKIGMKI